MLYIYHSNYRKYFNLGFISSYSGDLRIKDFVYFLLAVVRVLLLCIAVRYACFHIHMSTGGSYLRKSIIARICIMFGKKVVFHLHSGDFDIFIEEAGPAKRKRIIKMLNRAEKIVVLSDSWYKYFSRYVSKEKLCVINNPSPMCDNEYRKKTNIRVSLLFMGRMSQMKGTYDLLDALKCLKTRNYILKLYGDGDTDKVRRIVELDYMKEYVHINSWVPYPEAVKIYDCTDVFILPSYMEGLPMTVLEAMGRGIPVLATNVGGIPEIIIDGENGFIVNPGDKRALVEKLEALISDTGLRERMGRKGLEMAKENFSVEIIGKRLEILYKEMAVI